MSTNLELYRILQAFFRFKFSIQKLMELLLQNIESRDMPYKEK